MIAGANVLLHWSLMEDMIRRGVHTFNFGRCTPDRGTQRFRKQRGGADAELQWTRGSGGNGRSSTPSPDAGLYMYAASAWQRPPLALANRVGPVLARRIP